MGSARIEDDDRRDQAQLDEAIRCLSMMSQRAASVHRAAQRTADQEKSVDTRIAAAAMAKRRGAIDAAGGPLCFGRIDEDGAGPVWYVGRRHVENADASPVVVDWRAPVAAPFYRATSVDPCGLERRRRFSIEDGRITAVFDEDLTDPEAVSGGLPDPLLAELDRGRTGQMHDIVATIAGEQDEIIRSGLDELLIVQGGPGTGKTAVGLHRAAFLLFTHRDLFADHQVLVIGPNPVFLRYIAEVLPSLGERSVTQTTLTGLLAARYRVRGSDRSEVAALKADARMATVLRRSMTARIKAPDDGLELRSGVSVIRFGPTEIEAMIGRAVDRTLPLNTARDVFRTILLQEAWKSYERRVDADPGRQPAFTSAIRSDPKFKKDFDRMWPTFSPAAVVRDVLGSPTRRRAAADGVLTTDEQEMLHRASAKKAADEAWTEADLPLLDEATAIASGVTANYGHVVVDEAQDHGPMAMRMLGRRARGHSMTVLGDLAQATAPGSVNDWADAARHLCGDRDRAAVRELTIGYRVPAAILDVANRLLPEAAPSVTPARSIRPGGAAPSVVHFRTLSELAAAVASVVVDLGGGPSGTASTSIAIIAPQLHHERVLEGLPDHHVARFGEGAAVQLPGAQAVALLEPEQSKGLEFDSVIVVDPDAIRSTANGLRRLYVAMTRAVQTLTLVEPS